MPFKKEIGENLTSFNWKPNNDKQAQFLALPSIGAKSIKEALMGGGAGSGKSELLLMYGIVNGWHSHPRFKQLFLRRTYPEISREILPRTQEMYKPLGAKLYKQDRFWQFPEEGQLGSGYTPSGGRIYFGHCENEDDVHNYDGMEINLFTPDELTSYSEFIYTYIGFTRVRSAVPELPAIIRASGMPGDVGHGWVKKRFVDPHPAGSRIVKGRGGNLRIYIHTTAADNKDGDPNYLQNLESLPSEAERRAKKFGDWSTYEGQVFDEFRERHYVTEPDNALHVINPFDIPKHWPRVCAIDWGYSAMCSVGWATISPARRLYVYRHQAFYREKIEEWAPKVKNFIDLDKPEDIVICASANQHRGDPHTILEQVVTALDRPSIRLGERDRIGGKALIHEYLRWRPKDQVPVDETKFDHELANWILRNKGELDYKFYCLQFQPQELEANIPRLLFFNDNLVKMIWDALKQCNYAKSAKDGKKKEDVAEFDGDDPYDMLRMLVHAGDRYLNEAIDAQTKVNKIDIVVGQFNSTNDMSQFYRNMRKLDESEVDEYKPIKRFHRGSLSSRLH